MTTDARAVQTVTVWDFPDPYIARCLNPNGRAHHMAVYRARKSAKEQVRLWTRRASIRPYAGLVDVHATFTFPAQGRHDPDNYTAILKPCLDALVAEGVLEDDDSQHVRLSVACEVEKGVRRLVLTLTGEAAA